ncbi:MAG: AAA family ATPase [Duodenibacillus sp.]|nr:AAA family ATPase [Duodenibacillus sp.]
MKKQIIAVCGKGGVGKTAITALMTRALKGRADTGRLLVVDADPALGLFYALGVETGKTIGAIRERVLDAAEAGGADRDEVAVELDYLILNALNERPGYACIAMGHMSGRGCFCSVNDLLRDSLAELVMKFDTILIDGEAGIEQINRQVVDKVDTLVLVSDSSRRGLQTVRQIKALVDDGSVPACEQLGVVINRVVGDARSREEIEAAAGLPVFGVIPYDPVLERYDAEARPLLEMPAEAASVQAVDAVIARIRG